MMTVDSDGVSNEPLNSFNLVNFSEMSSLIQGSKSTTCLLDLNPTHLNDGHFNTNSSVLDWVNCSLATTTVLQGCRNQSLAKKKSHY